MRRSSAEGKNHKKRGGKKRLKKGRASLKRKDNQKKGFKPSSHLGGRGEEAVKPYGGKAK